MSRQIIYFRGLNIYTSTNIVTRFGFWEIVLKYTFNTCLFNFGKDVEPVILGFNFWILTTVTL
jgi:hypothetical protein